MFVYDNLGLLVAGAFTVGVTGHFTARWRHRHRYFALRDVYEGALRDARESGGDTSAVVRWQELQREFMRASLPRWLDGFGRRLLLMTKVCGALTLVALFFKAPLERREAIRQASARSAVEAAASRHAMPATARR